MAEGEQGLSDGVEEDFQEEAFVGKDEGIEIVRESEDNMEIADGQDFRLASLEPASRVEALALGAMPIAAGVVGWPFEGAAVASLKVAAESGSAAALDGAHDFELRGRQGMGAAEGLAMEA